MNRTNALIVAFVILLLAIAANTTVSIVNSGKISSQNTRLNNIVQNLETEAKHTSTVQKAGGPVAVCLLDALKATEPLLLKIPSVDAPLTEYVNLQSHRYLGVKCP